MVTIAAVYGTTIQSINWSFVVISQDEWNEVDFSTSPIFIGLTWIKQHFNGWKWLRATFSGLKTHSTRGWKSWIWFASRAFRAKPSVRRKTKQPAASWIDTMGFWISPWRQRSSKISGSTVIFFLVPKFGWSANLLFCQTAGHEKNIGETMMAWFGKFPFRRSSLLSSGHLLFIWGPSSPCRRRKLLRKMNDSEMMPNLSPRLNGRRYGASREDPMPAKSSSSDLWSVNVMVHWILDPGYHHVPPILWTHRFPASHVAMVFHSYLFWRRMFYRNEATGVNWTLQFQWSNAFIFHVQMFQRCFKRAIYGAFHGWYAYYRSSWETSSLNIGGAFPAALGPILSRFKNWSPDGPRGPCWDLVGALLGPCWYTRLCLVPHWCHHFSTFTPKHSDDSSSFLPCSAAFAKVKSWKVQKRHEGGGGVPCSPQLVEQWSIKENSATTLNHMIFSGKRKTNQNHYRKFQQPALNKHISSSSSLQLVQQCISQWVEKINASICWTIFVNRSIHVPSSRQPIN